MASSDDWPAVAVKLRKDQKKLVRILRILGQSGMDERMSGTFLKVVV